MDSDALEANLLNKFRSMGTTDKDVLISQFQDLLGFQLNPAGCAFFLDMTGWNLQSAIGAYYDFEGGQECGLPSMTFVSHITVQEGEAVLPNTPFVKTWRIQNSGKEQWPSGCQLRFINGEKMTGETSISVPRLSAGDITDISINLTSPNAPGVYQGQWRTYTSTDTPFGDVIWVIVTVQGHHVSYNSQAMPVVDSNDPEVFSFSVSNNAHPNHSMVPVVDEEMVSDDSNSNGTFSNTSHLHSNTGFNL